MGFWFAILIILFIYLVVQLILKFYEDKRVRHAIQEMPGKVVVITGASSVLGEAIAHQFYTAGCKVILIGPNEHELERVRNHLISLRPKQVVVYQPEVVALDLSDTATSVSNTVAGILEQCGQVDILVNNANICTRSDALTTSVDTDVRVMNINYFGPVAFTKAVLPSMIHRKSGRLIFISSVAGKVPIPFRSSFAASKHALQAFCDSLRAEIAMHNVKVLVSSPEYIACDLSRNDVVRAGTFNEVTEKGASPIGDPPQQIAESLIQSVLRNAKEDTPLAFSFAYWLRVTFPSFFHFMMARRAEQATTPTEPQRY